LTAAWPIAWARKLFPTTGGPSIKTSAFTNDLAGRQVEDLLALHRRVEGDVELVQALKLLEHGGANPSLDQTA
jgi:hypothetical protein